MDPTDDIVSIALARQRQQIAATLTGHADDRPDADPHWLAGVRWAAEVVRSGWRAP